MSAASPSPSPSTPVGYAEVPDFHAALARQADPSLVGRPVVVGGDPSKRGKVVAASADLRARGIVDGMPTAEALSREPEARWVRTDMARAREASGRLRAAIREVVEAIETEGLAGFYLHAPDDPAQARALGDRLAARVDERVGLPLRFGVAPVRFAARLAAEEVDGSGARVIEPEAFEAWLGALPLERLPGVGPKTAARLAELGADDVPGLRRIGLERLEVLLGPHGRTLWRLATGEDPTPMRARRRPESLSRETALEGEAGDDEALDRAIVRLAGLLEAALRRDGLQAGRIALRLSRPGAGPITRSQTLMAPLSEAVPLAEAARDLLGRIEPPVRDARRVAIVLKGLSDGDRRDPQLDLFS